MIVLLYRALKATEDAGVGQTRGTRKVRRAASRPSSGCETTSADEFIRSLRSRRRSSPLPQVWATAVPAFNCGVQPIALGGLLPLNLAGVASLALGRGGAEGKSAVISTPAMFASGPPPAISRPASVIIRDDGELQLLHAINGLIRSFRRVPESAAAMDHVARNLYYPPHPRRPHGRQLHQVNARA